MISSQLLGRYEFCDKGSNKFWTCIFNTTTKMYDTEWGKNGYGAQGTKRGLSEREAAQKIREKMNKGYKKSNAIDQAFKEKKALVEFVKQHNQQKAEKLKEEKENGTFVPPETPVVKRVPLSKRFL